MPTSMPFVTLPRMHEHFLMAKEFGIHPALTFGVDPTQDQMLGYQLMRATFYAGRAVEQRLSQTTRVLEPAPESPPRGMFWTERPVWTYRQAVGLDAGPEEADDANAAGIAERARQPRTLDPETADLLRELAG